MRKGLLLLALVMTPFVTANAQSQNHIFAQVADGVFGDGTYYTTTFMILPQHPSASGRCDLMLRGLTATLTTQTAVTYPNTSFINNLQMVGGSAWIISSSGDQDFRSGFATLTCDDPVFATALYAFYAANGAKLAEATVFSTEGLFNQGFEMIVDEREGARLGVAIANNSGVTRLYQFAFGNLQAQISLPPLSSQARFLDELMWTSGGFPMPWPTGAVGVLDLQEFNQSNFGLIGLRFTGSAFTTIPGN